jgi:hypothetical protein
VSNALEFFKSIARPSTIFRFFDKATRLIAGSQKCLAIRASLLLQVRLSLIAKLHPQFIFLMM